MIKLELKVNDNFSFEKLVDIHFAYGAANFNRREVARLFEQRYPERRMQPHDTTSTPIDPCLRESVNLKRPGGGGRPRTARLGQFEKVVLLLVRKINP